MGETLDYLEANREELGDEAAGFDVPVRTAPRKDVNGHPLIVVAEHSLNGKSKMFRCCCSCHRHANTYACSGCTDKKVVTLSQAKKELGIRKGSIFSLCSRTLSKRRLARFVKDSKI